MNNKNAKKAVEKLSQVFGFQKYLNDVQKEAVSNIFQATRDVFVRGFGKSLCYQLPVLIKDNCFIIVISCRTSFIERYQQYFKTKNIKTNFLTSNTTRRKRLEIENDIFSRNSDMKILFITPCKYESAYFKTLLKQIKKYRLLYIVIDQAENIISKHENLRRQYANLDLKIVKVPIVAVSSSANLEAQKDIIKNFCLLNPKVYAMPILRSNLYHDIWYINTLPDPLAHLIKFIQNFYPNSVENDEFWGVIVCKDWEATISIARYLTSVGISALPHSIFNFSTDEIKNLKDDDKVKNKIDKLKLPAPLNKKNKYLGDIKKVKVITVCDEVGMLTVTNSPDQIIVKKSVRFIVYWYALPSIQKYYLELSQARYSHGMSYCRIYCLLEELMNKDTQSSGSHDESLPDIKTSLVQMQCRHKVYSEYCGDTFLACKYYCDVCKEREEVEKKKNVLLQLNDNEYLEKTLRETLQFSKNSATVCDKNLQYEGSNETISSEYQTKNSKSKETKKSNGDHPSLGKSIQYIEENNTLNKKSQALPKSVNKTGFSEYQSKDIAREAKNKSYNDHHSLPTIIQNIEQNYNELNKRSQTLPKKADSNRCKTKNIEKEPAKKSNDNHPSLNARIKENNNNVDKEVEAVSNLSKCYKYIYGTQQPNSICALASTQSYNVRTISPTNTVSVKKSRNRNRETKISTIEVITIDDEASETEEYYVQKTTAKLKKNVPYTEKSDDDDVIFIKQSRKRRRSQDSNLDRKKRRK